jgi:hypothetical protein
MGGHFLVTGKAHRCQIEPASAFIKPMANEGSVIRDQVHERSTALSRGLDTFTPVRDAKLSSLPGKRATVSRVASKEVRRS